MFILAAQRHSERAKSAAAEYEAYLAANRERFPPSAIALAMSTWYYDFRDHRCPHDAWLEEMRLEESATGARFENRTVALRVRLLGAYHDRRIEFYYPQVYNYELTLGRGQHGHCDWRYDELRLSDGGHVLHEIEWAGAHDTGRWLIEASDVEFSSHPIHPVPDRAT